MICRRLFIILFLFSLMPLRVLPQDTIIDGIVAVVGGHVILKSDVETQYLQFRAQGNIEGSPDRVKCQILESLLYQKLLFHQAEVDSITVTDSQVENEMDRRMRYFISQAGSPDKLEEYYNKSIMEIKEEMREVIKEQMMVNMEQEQITKNVSVTPADVKSFFRKIPTDSIPEIGSEVEIGIIVCQPEIGEEQREQARQRLTEFKERINNGDDFSTLAILYSEDPGSAKQGGELGMFQRGDMRSQFEAAVFKLKPGEVSDIVETEDGFHLIQLIERRGDFVNARHILLQPKVSPIALNQGKLFLDSVATLIREQKITYDVAVIQFSDDPSKNNGGLLINPATGNTRFAIQELDQKIFFVIDKLKKGAVSSPVKWEERGKESYRIYYLKERTIPHLANLDEDYARVQEWTLEKKKMDLMDQWIDNKVSESFIQILMPYAGCTFERKWITNE